MSLLILNIYSCASDSTNFDAGGSSSTNEAVIEPEIDAEANPAPRIEPEVRKGPEIGTGVRPPAPGIVVEPPISPEIVSTPVNEHFLENYLSDPAEMILSEFQYFDMDSGRSDHPASNWEIKNNAATQVMQTINALPSVFYHNNNYSDYAVEGFWQTASDGDDDYMGFVFGMQDEGHYYLFSWKAKDQSHPWGMAKAGMNVRVVNIDDQANVQDMWVSRQNNDRVKEIYHNDIPWQANHEYKFSLIFRPGEFTIVIENQLGEILSKIDLKDDTYQSGKFGFYNFSQPMIAYRGFSATRLAPKSYSYQVVAEDEDSDELTYSLITKPAGMSINSKTGLITWNTNEEHLGAYKVKVKVEDKSGLSDTQAFDLSIGDVKK